MTNLFSHFAAACTSANSSSTDFLGFPKWYKYLQQTSDPVTHICTPELTKLTDIWLILAAIIELMLRVAALAAVFLVIYGGVQYIISQGEPDKISRARSTIQNAVIGLVISITAAATVAFIAGRVS
jgi:hypothetical protein